MRSPTYIPHIRFHVMERENYLPVTKLIPMTAGNLTEQSASLSNFDVTGNYTWKGVRV